MIWFLHMSMCGIKRLCLAPESSPLITLNTFTLAPGAYLLHVETAEGVQMVKLVKE
jgi:hypothetical protein